MLIKSINPANNQIINEYEEMNSSTINNILENSVLTYNHWRKEAINSRSQKMHKLADLLIAKSQEFGTIITLEMGKPITQSIAEVEKCAFLCRYYADNAEKFLESEYVKTDFSKSFISYQPLGVVLAIMPWNFPFWQVLRFSVPAIMAGNCVILKHASNVTDCALAIESLFEEAGFPKNTLSTVILSGTKVDSLIADKRIEAVTFTGSTPAGRAVAISSAKNIKKSVLELGGSDPAIVLEDADLALATSACSSARLSNAGQSCIAPKRFIVHHSVYDEFTNLVVEQFKNAKIGDPMDSDTDIGPLAKRKFVDDIHNQVRESIKKGAKLLTGGDISELGENFYMPTVIGDVKPNSPAWDEELFGPVASIIPAKDEEEAIKIANDTSFGLGASIFTQDIEKGERIAEQELQAGSCFVNDFVRSDPRLPFGGIKESGYGRELGLYGLRELVNIKTIVVR